ncbi:MAG: CoA ester lyase [Microbacteriaceae bacterium]|nr:MAG: CoA ester lyase [Microbacteriaceae bacterium]
MAAGAIFALGPALLFCPADRPDRFRKALDRADAVILDLEDAVAPADRPAARDALRHSGLDPTRVIVRINSADSADFGEDLAAVRACGYRTVMLPKAASHLDARRIAAFDESLGVIALCESAAGIAAVREIAAESNVAALMWGAEDLIASLGGMASRFVDGRYRPVAEYARAAVLIAAGAAGKAAIDTVHLDIADTDGLAAEAADAVASGFQATACIHPSQVEIIRAAYRPSTGEVADAQAMLAAAREHPGVFRWGDRMVDAPVLRHAEAILRRARP